MEKYSRAVSEMYSQFKQREAHPLEKYIGRLTRRIWGGVLEVVGYSVRPDGSCSLIVESPQGRGWVDLKPCDLKPYDVIFKECEGYWYASIHDLIE